MMDEACHQPHTPAVIKRHRLRSGKRFKPPCDDSDDELVVDRRGERMLWLEVMDPRVPDDGVPPLSPSEEKSVRRNLLPELDASVLEKEANDEEILWEPYPCIIC